MYSTELCLASSKILTPHPPLHPTSVSSPPHQRRGGGGTHSPGGGWVGVKILEDARHWIGLLIISLRMYILLENHDTFWLYFTEFSAAAVTSQSVSRDPGAAHDGPWLPAHGAALRAGRPSRAPNADAHDGAGRRAL